MAHNARIWPAGLTNGVSKLDHAELEALDIQVYKSINGDDGGTWAPAALVVVGGGFGIQITGAGTKLKTAAGGRLELGDSDYVKLGAGHAGITQTRTKQMAAGAMYASAWTIALTAAIRHVLVGPATNVIAAVCLNDMLHNGATLTSASISFAVTGGSHLPAVQPSIVIEKFKSDGTNTAVGNATLAAGTGAAYYNGGTIQSLTKSGMADVIDKSLYSYALLFTDESGAGAIAGNLFYHVTTVETLADVQPF